MSHFPSPYKRTRELSCHEHWIHTTNGEPLVTNEQVFDVCYNYCDPFNLDIEKILRRAQSNPLSLVAAPPTLPKAEPNETQPTLESLVQSYKCVFEYYCDILFLVYKDPSARSKMNKCVREHQLLEKMWDKIMDGFVSIKKHLPESQHHFLDLLYATYHMFTMLYERFPEYSIFWSLKLGDIAWVRSKLEVDEGIWDSCVQSECWVEISYSWYHQATTLQPDIGALHWNLMPLIKYDALSALFLLYKTLTARKACLAAHTDEGINKSIDLLMKLASSCPPEIKFFINSHISDFLRKDQDLAPIKQMEYLQIHKPILMTRAKSDLQTIQIAVCGISSLTLEASKCKLEAASTAKEKHKVTKMSEVSTEDISGHLKPRLVHNIAFQLLSFALENPQNERIHRHIHIWLIFLDFIQTHPAQMAWVVKAFPWSHLTQYATWLLRRRRDQNQLLPPQHDIEGFPFALGYCPLPEEILVRGLNITGTFFPENYFANCSTVPNTIYRESPYPGVIETTGMGIIRQEKILWLLMRLAKSRTWIVYNPTCSQFTISPKLGTFLRRD